MRTLRVLKAVPMGLIIGLSLTASLGRAFVDSGHQHEHGESLQFLGQNGNSHKLEIRKKVFRGGLPILSGRLQFRPDLKGAKIYRDALTGDLQKIEGNLGVELSLATDDLSVFIEAALLFVEQHAAEFQNFCHLN